MSPGVLPGCPWDIPPGIPPGVLAPALPAAGDDEPPPEDLLPLWPLLPLGEDGDPPDGTGVPPPGARLDVPPPLLPLELCMPELLQATRIQAVAAATPIHRKTGTVTVRHLRRMLTIIYPGCGRTSGETSR
jgi:hypothetical protein